MGSKPEGSRYGLKSRKHHLSSANLKLDSEYRTDVMMDVGHMKQNTMEMDLLKMYFSTERGDVLLPC